jgi:acetyltransferase
MFGPVLLFGAGGTAVEVLADRAIALPPLNRVLAAELISRTRISRLLAGYRNHPPAKLDAVCDVLMAVSQMLADIPELAELDINPLWADDHGVMALDARVRLSATKPAGAANFAITPYPAELVQTLSLEGQPLVIRPIRPEDEPQHRAFIERLSPGDLRLRFFSSRRDLPRSEIARLTQIDYAREMAFIAVQTGDDGVPHTLGVVRALSDPDNIEAEFAIIVRSDQQSRGLGAVLLRKMVDYLKSRGTQRMVAIVRSDNRAMLELADSVGCVVSAASRDTDELHLVLKLADPHPNPLPQGEGAKTPSAA